MVIFLRPVCLFSASRVQYVSDLHPKFALSHTMCGLSANLVHILGENFTRSVERDPHFTRVVP